MLFSTGPTKENLQRLCLKQLNKKKIEMRGQCLDEHGNSAPPGEDKQPGQDGSDGWSTIREDTHGFLTVMFDTDFRPRRSDDVWKDWKK